MLMHCVITLLLSMCAVASAQGNDIDPCANHPCPEGQSCKQIMLLCLRVACPPVTVCVNETSTSAPSSSSPSHPKDPALLCPENEVFARCFSGCERVCGEAWPKPCPMLCKVPGGCRCADGYVRAADGKECIPESECPDFQCGENEVYNSCFNGCQASCQNPRPICTRRCGKGGCACVDGFVKSNGTCVLKESCPDKTTVTPVL